MNDNQIKKLELKKIDLLKEMGKVEDKIDSLIDKDREREFLRLKKEVEKWNKKYDGHFIEEIKEVWDKEEEEENRREQGI